MGSRSLDIGLNRWRLPLVLDNCNAINRIVTALDYIETVQDDTGSRPQMPVLDSVSVELSCVIAYHASSRAVNKSVSVGRSRADKKMPQQAAHLSGVFQFASFLFHCTLLD